MSRSKKRGSARAQPATQPSPPRPPRTYGLAVLVASLLMVVAAALVWLRGPRAAPWNVVVVSIDTLRADELSVYGGPVPAPNLARLAREGVVFENVHTVAPLTLPAHASLFTARWPYQHGVRDNVGFYLPEGTTTLASHLLDHGYRTGGFVSAFVLDSRFGVQQGFERYFDDFDALDRDVAGGFVSQRPGRDTLDEARVWMADVAEGDAPFFAFVHLFEPHTPYDPPERLRTGSDDRSLYRAEIALADELVGELLDWIDQSSFADRTLVAVLSDHGESLGEHGEATHGLFVYESTLRVPLILRYPGAAVGARVRQVTRLVDVAPTLLELVGLPTLPNADGTSRVDSLGHPDEPGDSETYAESFLPRLHYGWSALRALRRGRHKLILAPSPELYDLDADPAESSNLFDRDPESARRLLRELQAIVKADHDVAASDSLDSDSRERLRALGYLGGGAGASSASGLDDEERADPKDRLDVYHFLNDPALSSLGPENGPGFDAALSSLARVIEGEPDIPRARILYGEMLMRAGRPRDAAEVFDALIALAPSYEGYLGLGDALERTGELDAAEAAYQGALAVEPRNTKTHARLAELASMRGDIDSAEQWLKDAVALSPDRVLRARLATLYLDNGRSQDAEEVLGDLAEEYRGDPVAIYNLGQTRLVDGDAMAALELFRVAQELDPDDADIRHGLANALLSTGNASASLEAYDAAIALAPCFAAAHSNRGLALAELGSDTEAAAAFRKAIVCDPAYLPAYRALAASQLNQGALDAAIRTLEEAKARVPGDPELAAQIAELTAYRNARR